MNRKMTIKTAAAVLLLAALTALFTGCAGKNSEAITSFAQLDKPGTKIGVMFDLIEFDTLKKDYPNAEIIAYNDNPLGYKDVANGRIDAYVYARREMELAMENGTAGVRLLDENYSVNPVAVGISPKTEIPDLQKKLNEFIAEAKADGTLDDMFQRWVVKVDGAMPDIPAAEHPQYHLRVGTVGTVMPYSYYIGTELTGYDIELAYR
ncbi:MAG: transporter substrate-binding domain-containing protein, partial [Clostridia bacterium]|nr:transporter substrate-binding domain-containing protein [Clostridia bacterium]